MIAAAALMIARRQALVMRASSASNGE